MLNKIFQTLKIPPIVGNMLVAKLPPQMKNQLLDMCNTASNSGNPVAYLQQQFGDNKNFQRAMNAVSGKTPEQLQMFLNNYIQTAFTQM